MKSRLYILPVLFILAMLLAGFLRYSGTVDSPLASLSGFATPLYVIFTVVFIIQYRQIGVNFKRFGFGLGFRLSHVGMAVIAVIVLQLSATVVGPILENVFGGERDLSRFSDVQGSLQALFLTLALSWSFAAFGEEIAYRIVLLGGLIKALGNSKGALIVAVVLQAMVFGLVHLYQGPVGVIGASVSGLVFGTVTVLARGAIWPAALAHGINNSIGLFSIYMGQS